MAAALWVLVFASPSLAGDDPHARALLDRAKELDRSERHWSDRRETLTFSISGPSGQNTREVRLYETRTAEDDHRVLVRFLGPEDVRGVGILVLTGKHGGGRQWLYSPEGKRPRTVSGSALNVRIAGSDVTYNDLDLLTTLTAWDASDADSRLRGDDTVDGEPCHVVELATKRAGIAYGRIVLWLTKTDLLQRRVELFRDGDVPVKRITQADIRPVGRIPVAHRVTVETLEVQTRTEIVIADDAGFDVGVSEGCFELPALQDPGNDSAACNPQRPLDDPRGGGAG